MHVPDVRIASGTPLAYAHAAFMLWLALTALMIMHAGGTTLTAPSLRPHPACAVMHARGTNLLPGPSLHCYCTFSMRLLIMHAGGTTLLPGLPTRLERDLKELYLAHTLKARTVCMQPYCFAQLTGTLLKKTGCLLVVWMGGTGKEGAWARDYLPREVVAKSESTV